MSGSSLVTRRNGHVSQDEMAFGDTLNTPKQRHAARVSVARIVARNGGSADDLRELLDTLGLLLRGDEGGNDPAAAR